MGAYEMDQFNRSVETPCGGATGQTAGINPKDILGEKKPPMWLFPAAARIFGAMVMKLGAAKYGPYNWRDKPVKLTIYLSAAERHVLACLDGEWIDPESGQPHLAHAMCCYAIVLDAWATGNMADDRPKQGRSAELIVEQTTKEEPAKFDNIQDALRARQQQAVEHARQAQQAENPLRHLGDGTTFESRDDLSGRFSGRSPSPDQEQFWDALRPPLGRDAYRDRG